MTSSTPASSFATGLVLQNRYRLDRALAAGGMAEVWDGHDLVLQRPVAVKLLHPHLASDGNVVERFRREAVAAARLSHPNIVPTYDTGTDNGVTYIVLGLVHGPDLSDLLASGPLEPRLAVHIARQVAEALEVAHRAGIVHRDIKPANILIVGDDHRVMVGDFGIAKAISEGADENLTLPGLVIGTPAYLAPEQATGRGADARSDVFATGVLLHEMVTGHTSGAGSSINEATQLVSVSLDTTEKASATNLPGGVAEVVMKATHVDPESRYQSATEMAQELLVLERSYAASEVEIGTTKVKLGAPKAPRTRTYSEDNTKDRTEEHLAIPAVAPPVEPSSGTAPPPAGAIVYAPPHEQRRKRLRFITIGVAIVLVLAAALLGRTLRGLSTPDSTPSPATTSAPLTIASADSFDPPPGDGDENNAQLSSITDNDPGTAWSSESYASRNFGNLKPGLGIVLQLNGATSLRSLQLETRNQGWSAQVYVAESARPSLDAWGAPVDTQSGLGSNATFDLHNANGASVLVWFTDLGEGNRISVANALINP